MLPDSTTDFLAHCMPRAFIFGVLAMSTRRYGQHLPYYAIIVFMICPLYMAGFMLGFTPFFDLGRGFSSPSNGSLVLCSNSNE